MPVPPVWPAFVVPFGATVLVRTLVVALGFDDMFASMVGATAAAVSGWALVLRSHRRMVVPLVGVLLCIGLGALVPLPVAGATVVRTSTDRSVVVALCMGAVCLLAFGMATEATYCVRCGIMGDSVRAGSIPAAEPGRRIGPFRNQGDKLRMRAATETARNFLVTGAPPEVLKLPPLGRRTRRARSATPAAGLLTRHQRVPHRVEVRQGRR